MGTMDIVAQAATQAATEAATQVATKAATQAATKVAAKVTGTVASPSKADAEAIKQARNFDKVDNAIAQQKASGKSPLPKEDLENIEAIAKDEKTVAKLDKLLADNNFRDAFCCLPDFRSAVLANARVGFPGKSLEDLVKTANSSKTQEDVKETKKTLQSKVANYDNEKQEAYFKRAKEIDQMNADQQAVQRLIHFGSGLWSGDRVCMTDSLMNIVGMGASMGKFGRFGGAFKLLSGFLGKDRFSSYLAGDFEYSRNNGVSASEQNAAKSAVEAGSTAINILNQANQASMA